MAKKNTFREIAWPILSLTIICLVVSLALGGVNMLTEKKIQDNLDAVANAGRREVLPGAADFEKVELTPETVSYTHLARWATSSGMGGSTSSGAGQL